MTRWVATITDNKWGLVNQQEYIGDIESTRAFSQFGWIKPWDDADPMPPKGINDYETGKSYPNGWYVLTASGLFKSNVGDGNYTSGTWVSSEWLQKI